MIGERDAEVANRIGNILLGILPASAERISATSEVGDDWAKTTVQFMDEAGTAGHFELENAPRRAIGDINRALIELREEYAKEGGKTWNRSVFTAHRDGKFSVEFSYADEDANNG